MLLSAVCHGALSGYGTGQVVATELLFFRLLFSRLRACVSARFFREPKSLDRLLVLHFWQRRQRRKQNPQREFRERGRRKQQQQQTTTSRPATLHIDDKNILVSICLVFSFGLFVPSQHQHRHQHYPSARRMPGNVCVYFFIGGVFHLHLGADQRGRKSCCVSDSRSSDLEQNTKHVIIERETIPPPAAAAKESKNWDGEIQIHWFPPRVLLFHSYITL